MRIGCLFQRGASVLRGWAGGLACLLWVLAGTGCAVQARLTADQRQSNVESFDYVWRTIRDQHWDPELGGLDWQAVHDEFYPKVQQADTMPKARLVMNDMIGSLGKSHFGIIPVELYEDIDQGAEPGSSDRDGAAGRLTRPAGRGGGDLHLRVAEQLAQ